MRIREEIRILGSKIADLEIAKEREREKEKKRKQDMQEEIKWEGIQDLPIFYKCYKCEKESTNETGFNAYKILNENYGLRDSNDRIYKNKYKLIYICNNCLKK